MKRSFCFFLTLCVLFTALSEPSVLSGVPSSDTRFCALFYPLSDESGLARMEITVSVPENRSLAEELVLLLMQSPRVSGALPAAGAGGRITLIENTLDVVTAGVETAVGTSEKMKALCAFSIWRTVMENTSANGVNVLIDGCCPAWDGEALNTLGRVTGEELTFEALAANARDTRLATVYRAETSGRYLIPVLTEKPDSADPRDLISRAAEGDSAYGLLSVWPEDFRLGEAISCRFEFDDSARRVLVLDIDDTEKDGLSFREAFAATRMQNWQFIASLSLTLLTGIPDINRVQFCLYGKPIYEFTGPDGTGMALENGVASRSSFSAWIAARLSCVRTHDHGTYVHSYAAVPVSDASDPVSVLIRCLPDALKPGDITAARVIGNTGWIDVSASFYAACQSLDERGEHDLVFRMVNALCENTPAANVRISVSGLQGETFAGHIRIDSQLWPDHGLAAAP